MKSKFLLALALIGFVAAACNSQNSNSGYGQNNTQQNQPTAQNPTSGQSSSGIQATQTPPGGVDGNDTQVVGINITANGFSPSTVTIHKGDYVMFTNKDTEPHWPASDPHPIHTDYPGFDAKHGLAQGETYTFQFNKVGSWGFHDHLNPTVTGTVVVQ